MIKEQLSGKRIFLTGGTGFVGTAVIERVLHHLQDTELVLLIREGRRTKARSRLKREILRNNCFDTIRDLMGTEEFDKLAERQIQVVAGDVGKDGLGLDEAALELLGTCDLAIHSAATVSFDAALDTAVEVNLLGPSRVAQTYQAALQSANRSGALVCVSTSYVAGSRKGDAPETSLLASHLYPDVSWVTEVDAARRLRAEADLKSRSPERLEKFKRGARHEIGAAGVALLADKTEKLRSDWVRSQMVGLGKARATSLGWPDAYAYTKALGEIALEELRGDLPTKVVRPSIIESALKLPYPGWIRGFRMAEPIIISFARGLLGEFPGIAEGTIDVIPVDLVVSAILTAAAEPPTPDLTFYQVASGSSNPLKYGKLVDLVRTYFGEHPLFDHRGQPIKVPQWSFPGRGKVQTQLRRATKALETASTAASLLPLRGAQLEFAEALEDRKAAATRALSYVELYGSYAECEANYLIDNLMEMHSKLNTSDLELFDFNPRQIDWDNFVTATHLPSVVEHSRAKTTSKSKPTTSRKDRVLGQILSKEPKLVSFDLENTLIAANVVDSFAWLASKRLERGERIGLAASLLIEAPGLLKLDRSDRTDFLRYFYRRYKGASHQQLSEDSWDLLSSYLLVKAYPAGLARVRHHRALGHKTVLITGALDFIVEPLSPLFDEIISSHMTQEDGKLSGEVTAAPPIGENRSEIIHQLAAKYGFDMADTVVYADSTSDLPMLEAAGTAVCVNPEAKLLSIAKKRGWHIEDWGRAKGYPSLYLPLGGTK